MGLGTDPNGPEDRSRWAWGEILTGLGEDPDGPGDRSQWAWERPPMGLGRDPGREARLCSGVGSVGWGQWGSVCPVGLGGQGDGRRWQGG